MTTKRATLKIEQSGLVDKLREDLTSEQRVSIRKRLAQISKELTALHEDQNKSYLFVREYDPTTKQFSLYKSPTPIKADCYYVAVLTHTIRLLGDKLVRTRSKGKMYKLKSCSQQFYLQSRDKSVLQQYIHFLAIDNVEIQERYSNEEARRREKEAWKHDGDMVKPLTRIPRDGTILLEGRRIK